MPLPRGWKHTEETKAKISAAFRGRRLTEETKAKLAEASRGHKCLEETKAKIAASKQGKRSTEETKAKLRMLFTRERSMALAEAKGRTSPETKAKLAEVARNRWLMATDDLKARMSRNGQHRSPEHSHKLLSAGGRHPNGLEKRMAAILDSLFPGEWRFTGDGSVIINHGNPDFTNVNGQKKIIEVYGDYWHRNHDPAERIAQFKQFGWDTLVVWEREVTGDRQQLEQRLRDFCEHR